MVPSRRRIAAALCLLIGTSVVAYTKIWVHFRSARAHSVARVGKPLPSLTVEASGIAIDLKECIAGRRSVIVFYSPSCRTCKEELPALLPFPATLRLILVNESRARDSSDILGFSGVPLLNDRWGVLSRSFGIRGIPTMIFVDENGILRDGLVGSHKRTLVQEKLKEFATRRY